MSSVLELDDDDDGVFNRVQIWTYTDGGRVRKSLTRNWENDDNGTVDVVDSRIFSSADTPLHLLHDGEGLPDGAGGTWDKLTLMGGRSYSSWAKDASEAESIQGIRRVNMAGLDIPEITFTMSDELLSVLAGTSDGYSLAIDSTRTTDTVRIFGEGIDRIVGEGSADSDGRMGYQGSVGTVYIDPDFTVVTVA